MAKRSSRPLAAHTDAADRGKVQPLFGGAGWDPLEEKREQSYIRKVQPRSPNQQKLLQAIADHSLTLAIGPAGTGKTYLAVAAAVEALEAGRIERIVLSRPAIEAGESLGYLAGG